jgi:hypothetical protein
MSWIGLIPSGPNAFLVNSPVCAKFFGLRPNGVNRNLTQHGFDIDRGADIAGELAAKCPPLAGQARHWTKRVFPFGCFSGATPDEGLAFPTAYACWKRGGFALFAPAARPAVDAEANAPGAWNADAPALDSDSIFT